MNNRVWTGVIIFAFVMPIVAMAYEMARSASLLAVGVFVALVLVWVGVMWAASRVAPASPPSRNHIPPLKPYAGTGTAKEARPAAQAARPAADKKTPRGRRA